MEFAIPRPLKVEYEALHDQLRKATKEPGEIGDAAKAVAEPNTISVGVNGYGVIGRRVADALPLAALSGATPSRVRIEDR